MVMFELSQKWWLIRLTVLIISSPPNRERMNLKAPIYFSTGLTEKANHYYKLFITWTNQKIRKTFVQRNMFEFKHIKAFDRSYADNPGPMVSAAAPYFPPKAFQMIHNWVITTVHALLRWCSPHQECCMLASLCRSLKNGLAMKRTWWVSWTVWRKWKRFLKNKRTKHYKQLTRPF